MAFYTFLYRTICIILNISPFGKYFFKKYLQKNIRRPIVRIRRIIYGSTRLPHSCSCSGLTVSFLVKPLASFNCLSSAGGISRPQQPPLTLPVKPALKSRRATVKLRHHADTLCPIKPPPHHTTYRLCLLSNIIQQEIIFVSFFM